MKTFKTYIISILMLVFSILIFTGFRMISTNQDSALIQGTWVCQETPQWKLVFRSDGKVLEYYDGVLSDTFIYTLREETSPNGKVKGSIVKFVNISNSNDTYEYEINTLTRQVLVLDYLGDAKVDLASFTKQ